MRMQSRGRGELWTGKAPLFALRVRYGAQRQRKGSEVGSKSQRGLCKEHRTWDQKTRLLGPALLLPSLHVNMHFNCLGPQFPHPGLAGRGNAVVIPCSAEDGRVGKASGEGQGFLMHPPSRACVLRGRAVGIFPQSLWFLQFYIQEPERRTRSRSNAQMDILMHSFLTQVPKRANTSTYCPLPLFGGFHLPERHS